MRTSPDDCRTGPSVAQRLRGGGGGYAYTGGGVDCPVSQAIAPIYRTGRIQNKAKLVPILKGSLVFVKAIDQPAATMYSLRQVMKSQGIRVQGAGREAYRSWLSSVALLRITPRPRTRRKFAPATLQNLPGFTSVV
jgi:hypothetical protein